MDRFTLRFSDQEDDGCKCPLCGEEQTVRPGLKLISNEHNLPVCRTCGKKWAPSMHALVDLAHTAEKVGKLCRHLLTPPMESLLDLARAAENYSNITPKVAAPRPEPTLILSNLPK